MHTHLGPLVAGASVLGLAVAGLLGLSAPAAAPPSNAVPPSTALPGTTTPLPAAAGDDGAVADPGAAGQDGTVRFTVAGDYAAEPTTADVLETMAARQPDLNLAVGDLSYGDRGEEQRWCDFVTERVGAGFPFQLLAGNHEADGRDGHINAFAACLPNQLPGLVGTYGRQWYVDVPQQNPLVRFVMISPGVSFTGDPLDYGVDTPRYRWTEAAIDGARAASIPWVVVGMHKPCLSIGRYECDSGRAVNDLLIEKDVDLVLNAHEHLYQRTKQLGFGPGCTTVVPGETDHDCIADSDGRMAKGAGTVFATVGTGGAPLREVRTDDPEADYFAASSGVDPATWGLLDVRVSRTQLQGTFVRAAGGTFTDAFTLTDPTPAPFAADGFERTTTTGLGSADVGGPWQVSGTSVTGGAGRVQLAPGGRTDLLLPEASSSSTDLVVALAVDRRPTGGDVEASLGVRRVAGVGEYRSRLRLRPDGTVGVSVLRTAGTTQTALAAASTVAGLTFAADDEILVRSQVTGLSPTSLRVRVWEAGTPEPTTWQVSTTDATPGLQAAGSIGIGLSLASSATGGPLEVSLDDLVARTP